MKIRSIDDLDVDGKRVLLRVDINSPIDLTTGKIRDDNRLRMSLPTIRDLSAAGAILVMIAHQGDTLDYSTYLGGHSWDGWSPERFCCSTTSAF